MISNATRELINLAISNLELESLTQEVINEATNATYLKVTYGLKPNSSPASIDISNISVTINGKSKPILAVGAFFASENCVVSEL